MVSSGLILDPNVRWGDSLSLQAMLSVGRTCP
jgi:hypothetical protein